MRLRFPVLVLLSTLSAYPALAADDPEAVVKAMIERDHDANLITKLPIKPDDYMRQHFTAAFNASWANAMSHSKDEPVLDGDVITGVQTATRVTLKSTAKADNGNFSMVSTNIVYFDDDGPSKPHQTVVRFFLKKEAGIWKVDDINAGEQASIRTMFKKSYGK